MFFVESGVQGVDEKVVHINDKPSFCDHAMERVIHELLEGGWGVGESKEHDGGFK